MKKNLSVVIAFWAIVLVGMIVSANADTISAENCSVINGTAVVEDGVCKGTIDRVLKIEIWLVDPSVEGSEPVTAFRIRNESSPSFVHSWYDYQVGEQYSGKLESGEEVRGTTSGSIMVDVVSQPWGFGTWGMTGGSRLTYSRVPQRVAETPMFVLFCVSALSVLYRMRYH